MRTYSSQIIPELVTCVSYIHLFFFYETDLDFPWEKVLMRTYILQIIPELVTCVSYIRICMCSCDW